MPKIKPLKKLRYKPQGSEVFYCSLIGIHADWVDPDEKSRQISKFLAHSAKLYSEITTRTKSRILIKNAAVPQVLL